MSKDKSITVKPYGCNSIDNEHWIRVKGDEFEFDNGEMSFEMANRLKEIFPDGYDCGNRLELHRQPTKEEIERLRSLARKIRASLELTIRTDDALEKQRLESEPRTD